MDLWERSPISQSDTTSFAVTFVAEDDVADADVCGVIAGAGDGDAVVVGGDVGVVAVVVGGDGGAVVVSGDVSGVDVGGDCGIEADAVAFTAPFPLESDDAQQLSNWVNSLG